MAPELSAKHPFAHDRKEAFIDIAWLLLFGATSTWWCVTAGQALSATFDEPPYLMLETSNGEPGQTK